MKRLLPNIPKVAIQGIAGCFHDAAARKFFAERGIEAIETLPCNSFPELFDAMSADASLLGIVAIENTIAGALLANHELMRQSPVSIIGEYKMRISHVLCSLPGETLDSITEVNSHAMALMQCEHFLLRHPRMKMFEKFDTAGSAEEIASHKLAGHAAVCGELAADLYGLQILEKGIETNKRNFTRFLVLADSLLASELRPRPELLNKASIVFTLPHTRGALSKVLTILTFYDINLSKIQSMPILGRE